MKSQHRHELETNELARRLAVVIDQIRPYASTAIGILVAVVVVLAGWSYLSGSWTAQRERAWSLYNVAVASGGLPNSEILREAAEEHPGTPMQELADVTWADGQVWRASRAYIQNRPAAEESINRAVSMYETMLKTSTDPLVVNRARLGLARVYEMQNKLEQARQQYLSVEGVFAPLAKSRAEQLEEQDAVEACQWLATAEPPRRVAPAGPGIPGQMPEFSAGDLRMPPESGRAEDASMGTLLEEFDLDSDTAEDRYDVTEEEPSAPSTTDESTDEPTDGEAADPPADDADQGS